MVAGHPIQPRPVITTTRPAMCQRGIREAASLEGFDLTTFRFRWEVKGAPIQTLHRGYPTNMVEWNEPVASGFL